MRSKQLLLVAGLATVLAFGLVAGRGTSRAAPPGPPVQDFNVDMVNCLLPSYPPGTVSPDPLIPPPLSCKAGEDFSAGGGASLATAIGIPSGDRLGYSSGYSGPGWVLQNDAQIADGTQVGDVALAEDYFQDGYVDWVADSSNCGGPPKNCSTALTFATAIPEQYIKQGLTFGPGTGWAGTDESYLNELTPGAAAMARYVRYRALVDTFYILGKYRVDMTAYNGSPTPLNLVTLSPVWSPVGTHVSLAVLSQIADRASPTTALLGLDSPQSSLSHTNRPYVTNPPVPGLYARWTTAISAADQADGSLNVVLSTSCKAIGGNFPDADADCTPDASEGGWCNDTGWPGYPATTVAGNPDSDDDGLLDGVEAAWGSNPCVGDTDGDGRTDTEEMVGPSQFLTNPKVMDSDGDGVDDGGLKLDLYDADTNWDGCQDSGTPDGRPDSPDEDGDGICDAGMSANYDFSGDGSSHRRVGFRIVGWDIQPDGAGQDNCPSIPNWDQVNFDLDTATTWGHGDLFGYECDTDDDNDGIVDSAELNFQYDQGAHQCANDPDLPGPATPLDPLNPDSDGDGVLDGVECEVGSNPADAGDSPGAPAADPDKDGVTNIHETFKRTQSFSNQPTGPVGDEDVDNDQTLAQCGGSESTCGQNDPDSDSDGLSDGCEVYVTGTNPLRPDSGGNGTPDAAEPNLAARIAAYCGSATDLDGDAVTNDVDNCLFVPNPAQTNTTPTIGNGKGIPGDDSTVPWSVTNDRRGDACDGDLDNDGLANASDTDPGGPALDNTYDDNNDGTWKGAGDDGPSWDTNMDAKLDGVAACAGSLGAWGGQDTDGDGLLNSWEFCKWGSSPNRVDSDGDTLGDCKEAADVDGDMVVDFVSDVVRYAKAILRSPASYGQDGDFDINGDANLSFASEVVQEAKFAFITGLCK